MSFCFSLCYLVPRYATAYTTYKFMSIITVRARPPRYLKKQRGSQRKPPDKYFLGNPLKGLKGYPISSRSTYNNNSYTQKFRTIGGRKSTTVTYALTRILYLQTKGAYAALTVKDGIDFKFINLLNTYAEHEPNPNGPQITLVMQRIS